MSATKDHALAMIQGARERWQLAARGIVGMPEIDSVGISAIDDALPYLKPDGGLPRYGFLVFMEYLLREDLDAFEKSQRRQKSAQKAVKLIMEAAALMGEADNHPLRFFLEHVGQSAQQAPYGVLYPDGFLDGQLLTETGEVKQQIKIPTFRFEPDAISGIFVSERGPKARDANIVKAIARYFPDSHDFLGAPSNGYAIIANLAALCGLRGKTAQGNPNEYVRGIMNKGHT